MDADRELFIEQLVAALQENTVASGSLASISLSPLAVDGASSSKRAFEGANSLQEYTGLFQSEAWPPSSADPVRLAHDAYKQLHFDFPQVHEASLEALAELYRRISSGKSSNLAAEFPITVPMLDSVAFLNDQNVSKHLQSVHHLRGSEGSGLLAASILLLVFRLCLEVPKDAKVDALLSSLEIVQPHQRMQSYRESTEAPKYTNMKNVANDAVLEKYAAKENPYDRGAVHEEHLEAYTQSLSIETSTSAISRYILVEKLHFLASRTFSSSFHNVSLEKWQQWHLDDELVAIIKLLVKTKLPEEETTPSIISGRHVAPVVFGPHGEWPRYLFVLRDRVLRFPDASRNVLWQLKKLLDFSPSQHFSRDNLVPHCVYRVLADLAASREFQVTSAHRASHELSVVIQALLPHFKQGLRLLVSQSTRAPVDLATVVVQLLHWMLIASFNVHTTTDKLYTSGLLRLLLLLLPCETDELHVEQTHCWIAALLRLMSECALWHADFAAYLSRVANFVKLLPRVQEQLAPEAFLVALAFHQHQLQAPIGSKVDIWETFQSNALFPTSCASSLDAVNKLQNAGFVLRCLEKGQRALRPAVQAELQCNLQLLSAGFTQLFKYRAVSEATTQQVPRDSATTTNKKEKAREEAETLHISALRNNLRHSLKSLLAALGSDSHASGRASSKLD